MTLESNRFGESQTGFEKKLGGKVWKSTDISIATGTTIQAGGTGNISVVIPNLDPFTQEVLPDPDTQVSTRSRYAQVGVDVLHSAGKLMYETLQKIKDDLIALVPVRNNSARPVNLPQGTRLFRLFIEPPGASLQREVVLSMIERGEITVSGERGRDWEVLFGEKLGLLWLKLNPDKRFWVPPHPNGVPIEILDDPGVDYRSLVDSFFKPAPISGTSIHWVGETVSELGLNPSVSAIIDRVPLGRDALRAHGSEHVNSLLLDGGSPEWPIRTEILSPTSPDKIPEYILLRFLKNE